jgi:type I restriction enzyme R subunit
VQFSAKANGKSISQVVKDLLNAFNPDTLEDLRAKIERENPVAAPVEKEGKFNQLQAELQNNAAKVFTGELNEYLENIRKAHEQKIDMQNPDTVINVGWDKDNKTKAETLVQDFKA